MSRTNCPNIVQYVEAGMAKTRDVYWIVMELLQGDSLERHLEDRGTLSEVEVIKVARQRTRTGHLFSPSR
jgi:serine/threonine protein kinase